MIIRKSQLEVTSGGPTSCSKQGQLWHQPRLRSGLYPAGSSNPPKKMIQPPWPTHWVGQVSPSTQSEPFSLKLTHSPPSPSSHHTPHNLLRGTGGCCQGPPPPPARPVPAERAPSLSLSPNRPPSPPLLPSTTPGPPPPAAPGLQAPLGKGFFTFCRQNPARFPLLTAMLCYHLAPKGRRAPRRWGKAPRRPPAPVASQRPLACGRKPCTASPALCACAVRRHPPPPARRPSSRFPAARLEVRRFHDGACGGVVSLHGRRRRPRPGRGAPEGVPPA